MQDVDVELEMCCGDTAAFIPHFPPLVCKIAPNLCKFTEKRKTGVMTVTVYQSDLKMASKNVGC